MKKQLLIGLTSILLSGYANAQSNKFWVTSSKERSEIKTTATVERTSFPKDFRLFDLNSESMRQTLFSVVNSASKKTAIISLPNADGNVEQFEVFEASNFDAELQAQFPEIRAFSGKGLTDKYATLKMSISPQGIQTMVSRVGSQTEFMEPFSQDRNTYAVYRSGSEKGKLSINCSTDDKKMFDDLSDKIGASSKSNTGQLKTMRLAQSCTGEYSVYHANAIAVGTTPTVAISLAAINATLTRCNGVYEKDLGLHLNLVASSTNVIYTNAATDPYGNTDANYNSELAAALDAVGGVGAANYDIGHLFSAIGNNGNAGCIGCVCDIEPSGVDSDGDGDPGEHKGSGFTTSTVPVGDNFDIDFVVHEVGHQLGANHTFSFSNEGTGVNMEPGSGVSIMGYAGITNQDVAPHSIDKFHAASINQIQVNLATKVCPVTTNITANNATPIVNAGANYTIPRSTPFMLTGSATDANAGDVLTYQWEQMDNASGAQTGANSAASPTKATGPNWRSYDATTSPVRVFPTMATVLNGQQTTSGAEIAVEALSSVARTLTFRLTVRDNAPYSSTAPIRVGQTNFDDMVVTVDATRGPLTVTSQNTTNQTWSQNSTQTITWNVNNTNTSAGGANVDILLSTDGGLTYPIVLLANTPNDGTQNITVPNITAQRARVMVKASGNIFFNVNLKDIAIGYTVTSTCNTYSNNATLVVPDNSPANNTPGTQVSKTINILENVTITDVNVVLSANHSYAWDMVVAMNHPDGTQVPLWNRNCNNASTGFNITFDDGQPAIVCVNGGSPTGTYRPAGSLASLNDKSANGLWTLFAADYWADDDPGSIGNWSIQICNNVYTLSNPDFEFEDFSLYPNPNKGDFTIKFTSSTGNDIKVIAHDLRGRQVYEKSFANTGAINQNVSFNNVEAGIYLVSIIDGGKKTVKRIIVE